MIPQTGLAHWGSHCLGMLEDAFAANSVSPWPPIVASEDAFAENSVSPWPPVVASQMQMQDLVIMRRGLLRLRRFIAHSKALDELCCMVPSKSPNSKI